MYNIRLWGKKIGELCREYQRELGLSATVVYPYLTGGVYGSGLITNTGASVKHDGTGYHASVSDSRQLCISILKMDRNSIPTVR